MSSQLGENSFQPMTPPTESPIATELPQKRRLYCLTVCGYRKPTLSEEQYGEYMTKKHSQLLKGIMAKHGVIRWTQAHNTTETRKLVEKMYGQSANVADYDCFSQFVLESIDSLVRMKEDPLFTDAMRNDHMNFADPKRTKITIGCIEEYITDGEVVRT